MSNPLSTTRRRAAAAVTTVALLAGGGAAALASSSATASAAGRSPATATTKAVTKGKAHKARRGLLARTDHATFEVKAEGAWVTLGLDRGKVTAVTAESITLHRPDGATVTEAIASTTKFNKDKTWKQIEVGHRATVISDNGTARRVVQGHKAKGV